MSTKEKISFILRLIVALIFIQTLYFKFTAHPDSVKIFTSLGVEPWGRISLGIVELVIAFMILIPKTKMIGMFLGLIIIIGAIILHIVILGLNVANDNGILFALAIIILFCTSLFIKINISN